MRINPYVTLAYGLLQILCVAVSMQPLLLIIALCSIVGMTILLEGSREMMRGLSWQLPAIAVFALLNCLFVPRGSTILLVAGPLTLHAESLLFGICMGMLVVCALSGFSLLSKSVSPDEVLLLFGGRFPSVTLMLSMSLRLVPEYRRLSKELDGTMQACTCAGISERNRFRSAASGLTHLLALSLEDSLACADSMRARGWSTFRRRTTYAKISVGAWDVIAIIVVISLGVASIASGIGIASCFSFYPIVAFGDAGSWQYVLYAAFFLIPFSGFVLEGLRWMR